MRVICVRQQEKQQQQQQQQQEQEQEQEPRLWHLHNKQRKLRGAFNDVADDEDEQEDDQEHEERSSAKARRPLWNFITALERNLFPVYAQQDISHPREHWRINYCPNHELTTTTSTTRASDSHPEPPSPPAPGKPQVFAH
ncbi:hypothetical protein AWZ03_002385 [Drosophila navojoa]|uniref:Uncharacterized protein n=1 Tax=Drosophila navojoa TaxID=7232 RepID=A0A484BRA5_DRONA|nr:hypothetical protein AWZ03_002385 [Drosophila navojoa]